MSESPNDLNEALKVAQREAANPSRDWTNYCQMFVRTTWGIPALFGSAWAQWLGADDEDKHVGGNIDEAPIGSALCFKGSGQYGHIELAAYPFRNGTSAAWSTDLVAYGDIDKVARSAAVTKWNQPYLGYLTAVNHYDLQLKEGKPAKPKQDKRYGAVDRAITNLEKARDALKVSRETARKQEDRADAKLLTEQIRDLNQEIRDLKVLYSELRRY